MHFFQSRLPLIFSSFIVQTSQKLIQSVSTDTRTLQPNSLFIPLLGSRFNGYQFISTALEKGACAIAVSKDVLPSLPPFPPNIWVFLVDDTLHFYQQIAKEYLKTKQSLIKIAITGSAGKTSTKEWLALLLGSQYKVYKTHENFNNQVGVPLSLLEVQDEEIAIFELGTGKMNDIKTLASLINPDICVITSIGQAHLEFFPSFDDIIKEKLSLELFSKKCYTSLQVKELTSIKPEIYPVDSQSIFDKIEPLGKKGYLLHAPHFTINFPFFGVHNIDNLALALKVALDIGLKEENIPKISFPPLPSFRQKTIKIQEATIILDCYNANPLSMKSAIKGVVELKTTTSLILADMLELDETIDSIHYNLGEWLNRFSFQKVIFIGKHIENSYEAYNGKKYYTENISDPSLKTLFTKMLLQKQNILIKGSRGMNLENLLNNLQ